MIFLTIIFFTISLYGLFRGSVFFESAKRIKLLSIDVAQGKLDADKLGEEFVKDGCVQWFAAVILLIGELIYLANAIHYDIYKIPTLIALVFFIATCTISFTKKQVNKMTDEELVTERIKAENKKRITLRTIVDGLLWTIYFGYMLYILVF